MSDPLEKVCSADMVGKVDTVLSKLKSDERSHLIALHKAQQTHSSNPEEAMRIAITRLLQSEDHQNLKTEEPGIIASLVFNELGTMSHTANLEKAFGKPLPSQNQVGCG